MYSLIMAPVDLGHIERQGKALATAADLAKHYGIPVVYVGVTTETPGPIAHTPAEYAAKLEAFAAEQAAIHGHDASANAYVSHDLTIDLDDKLLQAVGDTGSDLVVMASHAPDVIDYIWPSNGGNIAAHSDASILLVR
ncbi:MAG TPA: universal stress protein [Thermohalobaculum sp.]|nr:universal stress protein [Thermohalobaculum sp.]